MKNILKSMAIDNLRIPKRTKEFIFLISVMGLVISCNPASNTPKPTEIFESADGEQESGYRKYFEESRRAALGDDWQNITQNNLERASLSRQFQAEGSLAGGLLVGDWYERGSNNVAGSTFATYFYPATAEVYALSSSGSLFKGGLTGGAWSTLNDAENFNNNILAVMPNGTGKRIVSAKNDHEIYYSGDEGASWTQAGGSIANANNWGAGGKKLIVMSNGILFYLQHVWLSAPDTWGSGYKLYRSSDNGATWLTTQTFNSRDENRVVMWSPFGTSDLYVMDNGATLYSLSGTATTLTTLATGMNLPSNSDYSLTGYKNGANLTLYSLVNKTDLYKTIDNGASWSIVSTLPASEASWSVGLFANPWVANALYYGNINLRKSTNGGSSFTEQNQWGSYYGNLDLLHADIMTITPFQKTDGTKFILIGNHGGIHYLPDPYTTTTNITKTNMNNTEYYDVVTIGGNIFVGTQDQGNQRFGGGTGTTILPATQVISGDYVRVNSSANGTKYWQEYPGGTFHYFDAPLSATSTTAQTSVYGTARTNIQQWVVPTCNWSVASENSILVGGGSITSGNTTESHVIKLTYTGGGSISRTEYPFNFLSAGGGYISAIDHSPADVNYMYVGLNNGKFYYSHDGGTNWTLTSSFTGPTNGWNYGSFIHASRLNKNLAFFSGSGGSIYKTTNGGTSFTNMSTGLPNTFVSEMVLNSSETMLFAATDAGPYVCVLATGQWYSMSEAVTPVKSFSSVEFVASENLVRFTTFGRGVWDFKITTPVLPVSFKSFDAKEGANQQVDILWATESERDVAYFEIEKSSDAINFSTLTQVKSKNKAAVYKAIDTHPTLEGVNYYRIKSVDLSGKMELTDIKSVKIGIKSNQVSVYPTVLPNGTPLSINVQEANFTFYLFDAQGRNVLSQKLNNQNNQLTLSNLGNGIYFYSIRETGNRVVRNGKLMVL
jgi:hypothetical protein